MGVREVLFFTGDGSEVRLGWRYKSVLGERRREEGETSTLKLRSGLSATPKAKIWLCRVTIRKERNYYENYIVDQKLIVELIRSVV